MLSHGKLCDENGASAYSAITRVAIRVFMKFTFVVCILLIWTNTHLMTHELNLLQCLLQYLHLLKNGAFAGASGGILQLHSAFVV
jgi:hypothetical protein